MQVLCKLSNTVSDVRCRICGQGFLVYWSRTSQTEQIATRARVIEALARHHQHSPHADAHPRTGFNVSDWTAATGSAAPALGGKRLSV
jgi:hypothetical protein